MAGSIVYKVEIGNIKVEMEGEGADLTPAIFSFTGVAERRAAGGRLSPDTDTMDWLYRQNW